MTKQTNHEPRTTNHEIVLAAKCSPEEKLLDAIRKAGIGAVELYVSESTLRNITATVALLKKYPFAYAIHANYGKFMPKELAELSKGIDAKVAVFHDIYWDDEWPKIMSAFKKSRSTKLCIENTFCVHEPLKFMRRYGMGRCLDLEHLQMECNGLFDEEFVPVIRDASHIHLTGYYHGSDLWHAHIHRSPGHNRHVLDLIKRSGYSGFVVSEARVSEQTYEQFRQLKAFFDEWISKGS